ncbi:MAG TPA: amidase [Bryobacteraceae bacterium]|nr:amidase [Bryobacteraceae bacterium]
MAEPDPDLFFSTIVELQARLRAKEVSALELARAFSARLERLGPRFHALALPLTERAIRRAKEVDDDLKRERRRGPLQGIPYGAKDLLACPGGPTAWGAAPYAGQVFDYRAAVIEKLDKAAAVLLGKLAMVELAGGPAYRYAAASATGPGLNPWDPSRWAGGSSSGSGAAVAAGLVPFAIGSETNGSIVTPAAFCGVTGLRPTYGLVSRYGAMALSWSLDKLGPLAHTAEDCGLVLQAISGGDRRDPASAGRSFYYTPQFARPLKEIKIGYAPVDFAEWADPEARPAFQEALAVFRSGRAALVEARLPDFPYGPVVSTILSAEAAAVFEPLVESGKVDQLADQKQIAALKAGLEIKAKDYLKAQRIRSLIQEALSRLFLDVDVLLAPNQRGPAPKITEALDRRYLDRPSPKDPGLRLLTTAGNLAGLPALALPCGFGGGMPLGIQLVGRPYTENLLLTLGREFQSRTDWHKRRPPGV